MFSGESGTLHFVGQYGVLTVDEIGDVENVLDVTLVKSLVRAHLTFIAGAV